MTASEPGPESCGVHTSPILLQPHRGWPTHSVAPSDQPSCAIVCGGDCGPCWPSWSCHRASISSARNPSQHNDPEANWSSICSNSWLPWVVDFPGHTVSTSLRGSSITMSVYAIMFLVRARSAHCPRHCAWVVADHAPIRPLPTIRPVRVRPSARRKEITP